ncbi:MAG: hypothetical protein HKO93_06350, partial [Flavobacteriales bacterium]|nr:hypothetical protein [Flavobacteriales bacterium]
MGRKKHELRKAQKAKKKQDKASDFQKRPWWVLIAILLTFISYSDIYQNQYLNYDDDVYVTENAPLRTLDVKTLFSEEFLNQYSPLAMTLMGYEFRLADSDPKVIRFFSVLVHILCVILVFLVFRQLFRDDYSAGILALLFGVHPMQVESVAWLAASMKIGTYAFFFLLSIWFYLRFKVDRKPKWMLASFTAFLASCFCKEQAVVLPLTLVSIDYLQGASLISKKAWLNKTPFLIVSLIFGIITLKATGGGGELAQEVYDFALSERVVFASYSIGMYIFKAIIPVDLSFFYTYPIKGDIPSYIFLFPILLIGVLFLFYKALKSDNRWLAFGILFFLVNVALTS